MDDGQVLSAAVTAGATLLTALVAIGTLAAARADSRDRSRPVVTVELRPNTLTWAGTTLVVRNGGAAVAEDVRVVFEPPIREIGEPVMEAQLELIGRRYDEPVEQLAPGQALRNTLTMEDDEAQDFTATVSYAAPARRLRRTPRYRQSFRIRPAMLHLESSARPSGKNHDERLTKAVEALVWILDA